MKQIKICPNCKNEISSEFEICPICGYKFYQNKILNIIFTILLIVIVIMISLKLDEYIKDKKAQTLFSQSIEKIGADKKYNSKDKMRDENLTKYVLQVQRKIKQNWHPTKLSTSYKVLVLFKITKDVELISTKIINSSGNKKADEEALYAVKTAAPFGKVPDKNLKDDTVDVRFTFDYNVFNDGKN